MPVNPRLFTDEARRRGDRVDTLVFTDARSLLGPARLYVKSGSLAMSTTVEDDSILSPGDEARLGSGELAIMSASDSNPEQEIGRVILLVARPSTAQA